MSCAQLFWGDLIKLENDLFSTQNENEIGELILIHQSINERIFFYRLRKEGLKFKNF
jgi:hypothetical protein